jgi:hypothetical protein
MRTIPAITLWQPWASLVAHGAKPFEFRSYPAPRALRGQRVAIHAGARAMKLPELRELLDKLLSDAWRETGMIREPAIELIEAVFAGSATIPQSSIVCTATLGAPIRDEALATQLGVPLVNDSDRSEHSNWGWPLAAIKRLKPIVPARGAQGWWRWAVPEGVDV